MILRHSLICQEGTYYGKADYISGTHIFFAFTIPTDAGINNCSFDLAKSFHPYILYFTRISGKSKFLLQNCPKSTFSCNKTALTSVYNIGSFSKGQVCADKVRSFVDISPAIIYNYGFLTVLFGTLDERRSRIVGKKKIRPVAL